MKKINNKGMAISGILYSILVLFIVLLFGILVILASSKNTFDKIKNNVSEKLDGNKNNDVTSEFCFKFDYLTGTILDYNNTIEGCGKNLVVPEAINGSMVKYISQNAFANKGLETVDLSNAVYLKEIADGAANNGAFSHNKIKELKFGELSVLEKIGNFAFVGNEIVGELDLSNLIGLKTIGYAAFLGSHISDLNLKNLNKLEKIDSLAFYNNLISGELDLSSLYKLNYIGEATFAYNSIEKVNTTNLKSLVGIGKLAFNNNIIEEFDFSNLVSLSYVNGHAFSFNKLKKVDFSNTNLGRIRNNAFSNNEISLAVFDESLEYIEEFAFANNILLDVDLSNANIKTLGNYAFYNNKILNIKYNGSIISLGAFANNEFKNISFANMPNVTVIDNYAFANNTQLQKVEFNNINLESIGALSFANCALESLSFPSSIKTIGNSAFYKNKITGKIDLSGVDGLTIMPLAFFENNITDLDLSGKIVSIGGGAFNSNEVNDDSKNVIYARNPDGSINNTQIVSYAGSGGGTFTVPSTVAIIGNYAFQDSNLDGIEFSESVTSVSIYSFGGSSFSGELDFTSMKNLTYIGAYSFSSFYYSEEIIDEESSYTAYSNIIGNRISYITCTKPKLTNSSIAKEIADQVTSINLTGLSKLETIDSNAFANLNNLKEIKGLETLTSLKTIGVNAFLDNSFECDIDLSNTKLTTISSGAFRAQGSKNNAGKLLLPDTLTSIGNDAFRALRLTEVTFPNTLESIGNYAFQHSKFTKLVLPEGLKTIGTTAFSSGSLQEVSFPSTLESIGTASFQENSIKVLDLSNVGPNFKTIPYSSFHLNLINKVLFSPYIESIATNAFTWCYINNITIPSNIQIINEGAFGNQKGTWQSIIIESDEQTKKDRFNSVWTKIGFPLSFMPEHDTVSYVLNTEAPNEFPHIKDAYKVVIPKDGKYQFDVWGAQGGNYSKSNIGGLGGYSTGQINLKQGDIIYVVVGGQPVLPETISNGLKLIGGFNNGGNGYVQNISKNYIYLGGGGATDIRIGSQSLYSRVIVAGGGSGASNYSSGYAGGGLEGEGYTGYVGTQTSAGVNGGFGYAGNTVVPYNSSNVIAPGGGSGFYGGGSQQNSGGQNGTNAYKMAGGGSGYVYTASTAKNYPSGCLLDSTHYLTNALTMSGNESVPTYDKSDFMEKGNIGDGYAVITYLGE